jgi:hypothetical protein
MGTNYFWYLDQELLHCPDVYNSNDNIPDKVKNVYRQALKAEEESNSERSRYLKEDDFTVPHFSFETGPIKVKALHIGKKSWGWCFGLHIYPGLVDNYAEWLELFHYGAIKNEYGDTVTKSSMIEIIDINGLDGINQDQEKKDKRKSAPIIGPHTLYDDYYCLYRRIIDRQYCNASFQAVDYCLGCFS